MFDFVMLCFGLLASDDWCCCDAFNIETGLLGETLRVGETVGDDKKFRLTPPVGVVGVLVMFVGPEFVGDVSEDFMLSVTGLISVSECFCDVVEAVVVVTMAIFLSITLTLALALDGIGVMRLIILGAFKTTPSTQTPSALSTRLRFLSFFPSTLFFLSTLSLEPTRRTLLNKSLDSGLLILTPPLKTLIDEV